MASAQITEIIPVEAFWHERLGTVIVFRIKCEPSVRDYAYKRFHGSEVGAQASVDGFIQGFTGKPIDELLSQVDGRLN